MADYESKYTGEEVESQLDKMVGLTDEDGYVYSAGEKVDMRFTRSLLPVGTSIPANANLNTIEFLKIGKYYCSQNVDAKTVKNCPVNMAFSMEVFNPLSTNVDDETTADYTYRLRVLTPYNTGVQYIQCCRTSGTPGTWTYDSWYVTPRSKFALASSKNDGSAAIGASNKGVYIDSEGEIKAMSYTIAKSVPSNAVFTDTNTKVTAVENHYAPAEDESQQIDAPEGEVVTGIKRDAAGHVVGVVSAPQTGGGSGGGESVYKWNWNSEMSGTFTEEEFENLSNADVVYITNSVAGTELLYSVDARVVVEDALHLGGHVLSFEIDTDNNGTAHVESLTFIFDNISKTWSAQVGSENLITSEQLTTALEGKQDTIEDLNAIRAGAEKGATALQPYITGFTYFEFETAAVNKTNLLISESEAQGLIDAINDGRIILIPCYDGGYALTLATISNPEVCVTVYFNTSIINATFLLDDILQGNVLELDSSETVVSNVLAYSASYDADAHTIPIRDSDGSVRVNSLKTDDIQVGIDEIRQTIDSLGDKVGKDEVIFKDVIGDLITAQTQALYGGGVVYALPDQANGDEDDVLLSRGTVKTINGQELLADENSNDITIAYPEERATSTAMALKPNTVTVWVGNVTGTIQITFALPLQGYVSEYIARFTVAADGVELIVPENVVWADGILPAMAEGKTYEISFLSTSGDNSITATFLEF